MLCERTISYHNMIFTYLLQQVRYAETRTHYNTVLYCIPVHALSYSSLVYAAMSPIISMRSKQPSTMHVVQCYTILLWLAVNRLSSNAKKTKIMIFHSKQNKPFVNEIPVIKINDTPIERVTEFKFLGVLIDSNLTWSPHCNYIASKLSRICGVLSRLTHYVPTHILTIYIYNSILIWELTILKSGARTPRTVTKFAVKTAIDLTQTI